MKYINQYAWLMILIFGTFCTGQHQTDLAEGHVKPEIKDTIASSGPANITRNIIQDRVGNIWAAAFDGVFRFDGKSFTNVTSKVSSARFFSILEDSKGNFWFGSIGSGVYHYDGKSFQNFTTTNGLINNEVVCIYEDRAGNIWFGANGGVSRYDGNSFQNYRIKGDAIIESATEETSPDFQRPSNEVSAILEDRTGKFWFGTRGHTFVYDGKKFATLTYDGKSFTNVRMIIEDRKGNVWLGGADGLWRYEDNTFTNITQNFVGYIYEDRKGNVWTSSQRANDGKWVLSRYVEASLFSEKLAVTEIESEYEGNRGMIFGILESDDGNIWLGTLNGVRLYDGNTITDFKNEGD